MAFFRGAELATEALAMGMEFPGKFLLLVLFSQVLSRLIRGQNRLDWVVAQPMHYLLQS